MNAYQRLSDAIAKVPDRVKKMRKAASQINDAPDFEHLLDTLEQFVHIHGNEPDAGLANEFASLRSQLGQFDIDPDAHEEGMQERWETLDSARGNLYLALDTVLAAARDVGIVPDKPELRLPDAETIARGGPGLTALGERLQAIEEMLRDRIVPEGVPGEGRFIAQLVQVNQYVRIMRRNITLFGLTLQSGDRIDLSALERVVATMGRITRDFHASITSFASRATASLRDAAAAARKPVGRLARGLGVVVKFAIRREFALARNEPPSDFDIDKARAMILQGEGPPASWRPWIDELDFSNTALIDLTPLQELWALQGLDLSSTNVVDLNPLAKLTALQWIDLAETKVSDLKPLSQLIMLRSLRMWRAPVRDITPLSKLVSLQTLNLWDTTVSDLFPVSGLINLEYIDLMGTRVSDISPLKNLKSLKSIDVANTKVADISPLAHLTALETLRIVHTSVRDLIPIQHLPSLINVILDRHQYRAAVDHGFIREDILSVL